jgi:ADP-heptose:LPS heptosyltransferase
LLTSATSYAAGDHVSANADRLVSRAVQVAGGREFRASAAPEPRLAVPDRARQAARALLAHARPPLIGVHVSGGRESKQWHLSRFAEAAEALAHVSGGTLVLTGGPSDRAMVDEVARALGDLPVIDAAETGDLVLLAAVLAELDVLVTGDTGPMHLAAAVGTPVVALFGPSNPARYGPRAAHERILRVDLPCSPCGLVRLPPPRCRGRVPECMDGITVESVVAATLDLLDSSRPARAARA